MIAGTMLGSRDDRQDGPEGRAEHGRAGAGRGVARCRYSRYYLPLRLLFINYLVFLFVCAGWK